MKLEGIHHVTCDHGRRAGATSTSTPGVLGLRLVKKTVNQDDPTVYHLFYADEQGCAGRRPHVLRVPGRAPRAGRRGHGPPHRLAGRARRRRSTSGRERLGAEGVADRARATASLRFADPEGLELELAVVDDRRRAARRRAPRDPGRARPPGLRRRARLRARPRAAAARCLERGARLRAARRDRAGRSRGDDAAAALRLRRAAGRARASPGAGTVHHVAWASPTDEHEAWRERVAGGGRARRRR